MSTSATNPDDLTFDQNLKRRHLISNCFEWMCCLATWSALLVLAVLLFSVCWQAFGWLDWQYLTSFDSRRPEQAGLLAGMWGTFWLILFTSLFSVPVGVGAAVYLEEYSADNLLTRIIKVNLANLAGVPSIVYGMLGLSVFVRMMYLFHGAEKQITMHLGFADLNIPLPLQRSVMAGALTLTLLILPVVIIASQEALRSIPPSIRHASYALGATQWQTIRHQVLPAAIPGIATGVILALSRAMGETAPLVMIGALTYLAFAPGGIDSPADIVENPQGLMDAPFDMFTAIPIQIYNWVSRPKTEYQHVAAAGCLVLLVLLLAFNAAAIFIRNRYQKKVSW